MCRRFSEESSSLTCNRLHHETAVERLVAALAAGLGDEQAAVACRARQRSFVGDSARIVVGADWIVGANVESLERLLNHTCHLRRERDQAPQSALRAR